jgi:hypothetical protein
MSKTIRFTLMLALTALAGWTSTPRPAHALPTCSSINGRSCFVANRSTQCNGGGAGFCICDSETLTWDCF